MTKVARGKKVDHYAALPLSHRRPLVLGGMFLAIIVAGFLMTVLFQHMAPVLLGMILAAVAITYLGLKDTRIDVGTDGVYIGWLTKRQFIAYRDIFDVVLEKDRGPQLRILTRDGDAVLPFRYESNAVLVKVRVLEAQRAMERDDVASPRMLARGDDSARDWVRRLRTAGDDAGFRRADDSERLWRVVTDDARAPTDRAAAAIALGPRLEEPDQQRIAQIAEGTAAPQLRVLLDAVARAEEEASLAEALEDVEKLGS